MNPVRTCIGCGQVDDHPRHVLGDAGGPGVDIFWHHDCHALATDCEVCQAVSAEGLTGDELREHIVANDPGGDAAQRVNQRNAESVASETDTQEV